MRPSLFRLALPISLAALVVAASAFAQTPPPPPGAPSPGGVAPPPPGAPPPPPQAGGPSVIIDRNGGLIHVDVHCAPAETTQACADLATRLHDKLNGVAQAK